ncbi:MAG: bifunctional DNA-formamidopyrimidine glycosylase/DNA-(apurinic or apyrimidinic site) lyase [Burkholderiales bacterium]|jgi:formamidopyrimidine-DNA glycosylase|nr:bifunctional DNA-formamidopyrimidine glycosylase/DNA-(apurinic or apyrimidinic site) lyase [Burkholderiales bacterium]
MPELPEVEVTRRALAPAVEGGVVRELVVREPRLRWPVPAGLAGQVAGRKVLRLERRGKYLLWRFEHGTLISHLGMSGSWRIHPGGAPPPGRHDHVDVTVEQPQGGSVLRLTDPRRFGALLWQRGGEQALRRSALLARLGIEPFDPRFDGGFLHQHTRGRRGPIKQVLLAGDLVVGVGNIYASESLFEAGIDPRTPAMRLSRPRCERLAQAIRAVLARAIETGGSSLRDFVGADGRSGYFTLAAQVYERNGLACLRCGRAAIRRIVQSARATYFCPHCQRR